MTDSNDTKEVIHKSSIVADDTLYEQIYNPDKGEVGYAYLDNGQLKTAQDIEHDGMRYVPVKDKFVETKTVQLPTEPLPYESEEKLLAEIQEHIQRYVDIEEEDELLSTWTIPVFHVYDKLNMMLPYLRVLGDTGCGKSRFLDVVGGLCYRPMFLGGSVTPAILYRAAEKWKGTMIIDEADWKNTNEYSEVIKILNCNQPNRSILRCRGDNPDEILPFNSWVPRIFATRRSFYDAATESRCITIQMKETSRDDIPIIMDNKFYREQLELRNKLLTFRLKNYSKINPSITPNIDFRNIEPRVRQIMYPIAVVFNEMPDVLQQFKLIMRDRGDELIKERANTYDGAIIDTYVKLHEQGSTYITASDIAVLLQERGYNMTTPQSLGHRLKSFGLTNKVMNVNGETKRCYQCNPELLEKLRKRYIPEYKEPETSSEITDITKITKIQTKPKQRLNQVKRILKRYLSR